MKQGQQGVPSLFPGAPHCAVVEAPPPQGWESLRTLQGSAAEGFGGPGAGLVVASRDPALRTQLWVCLRVASQLPGWTP